MTAYDSTELPRALAGADLVINAVTSDGAVPVLRRAATRLAPGVPVLSVSKGLAQSRGRAVTLSDALADEAGLHIVTVGGPSKALELARRVPTAVVYASPQAAVRRRLRQMLETAYYRVEESADQRGLELCSALKNAYAIAIGLCDGLVAAGRAEAMYNTKSALYTQALREIARLGLDREDARGHRPRAGRGGRPARHRHGRAQPRLRRAARRGPADQGGRGQLKARDELTEGYAAIRWCWRFARERKVTGVPLLHALHRIVYGGHDVERELTAACFGSATPSTRSKGGRS